MKLTYTARSGRIAIEAEVASDKAAFETLATFQEILDEPACGCCGSDLIRHDVRIVDDNKFFQMTCRACGARLDFGQTKKGDHLFAKRKSEDKQRLPNGGCYVFTGERQEPAADPEMADIAVASSKAALRAIGEHIKREVAAGRIDQARAKSLRAAYDARSKELATNN